MKRILYVEDDEDTASAVRALLTRAGYEAELAFTGQEGIKKAISVSSNYDLILLDMMLPDMSGWEVFKKLKGRQNNVQCSFAFVSAVPLANSQLMEYKREGISDYISKPFTKAHLLERINRMIK
jgi:DNA-binding response OmpR family regulator